LPYNLHECDLIIFPIHVGASYWTLVALRPKTKNIYYMDSLHEVRNSCIVAPCACLPQNERCARRWQQELSMTPFAKAAARIYSQASAPTRWLMSIILACQLSCRGVTRVPWPASRDGGGMRSSASKARYVEQVSVCNSRHPHPPSAHPVPPSPTPAQLCCAGRSHCHSWPHGLEHHSPYPRACQYQCASHTSTGSPPHLVGCGSGELDAPLQQ